MAILWDDVPMVDRRERRSYAWYGCPYAVKARFGGYGRCAGSVPNGYAACAAHDPSRQQPPRDQLDDAVRSRVRKEEQWRHGHGDRTPALAWFRALDDDHIDVMRMVGKKIKARICEIRDTWDDERVQAFFEFPVRHEKPKPDPLVFWASRPAILNVVGG